MEAPDKLRGRHECIRPVARQRPSSRAATRLVKSRVAVVIAMPAVARDAIPSLSLHTVGGRTNGRAYDK